MKAKAKSFKEPNIRLTLKREEALMLLALVDSVEWASLGPKREQFLENLYSTVEEAGIRGYDYDHRWGTTAQYAEDAPEAIK